MNKSIFIGCRLIGKGHGAAALLSATLNMQPPVNTNVWKKYTKQVLPVVKSLVDQDQEEAALRVKRIMADEGLLEAAIDGRMLLTGYVVNQLRPCCLCPTCMLLGHMQKKV